LEELKYNTEQTAANTGPETQYKVAWNALKRVDGCLWEGGGLFQHLLSSWSTVLPNKRREREKKT
jgi:hypothetical protein